MPGQPGNPGNKHPVANKNPLAGRLARLAKRRIGKAGTVEAARVEAWRLVVVNRELLNVALLDEDFELVLRVLHAATASLNNYVKLYAASEHEGRMSAVEAQLQRMQKGKT